MWRPCADRVAAAGHRVALPDLRDTLDPPERWWDRAAAAAVAGVDGSVVVVAHSGAGVLLSLVTDQLADVQAAVFVDALLPAGAGDTAPSERFRSFLAGLPVTDGRLPPWSTWWGPTRWPSWSPTRCCARIEADQRGLPAAFYGRAVPVPASWPPERVGYLRLSPAYESDAAEAAARGWPVRTLPGGHLDLATRPEEVAALIIALAGLDRRAL